MRETEARMQAEIEREIGVPARTPRPGTPSTEASQRPPASDNPAARPDDSMTRQVTPTRTVARIGFTKLPPQKTLLGDRIPSHRIQSPKTTEIQPAPFVPQRDVAEGAQNMQISDSGNTQSADGESRAQHIPKTRRAVIVTTKRGPYLVIDPAGRDPADPNDRRLIPYTGPGDGPAVEYPEGHPRRVGLVGVEPPTPEEAARILADPSAPLWLTQPAKLAQNAWPVLIRYPNGSRIEARDPESGERLMNGGDDSAIIDADEAEALGLGRFMPVRRVDRPIPMPPTPSRPPPTPGPAGRRRNGKYPWLDELLRRIRENLPDTIDAIGRLRPTEREQLADRLYTPPGEGSEDDEPQ